jgi:transcriptional regulator with XRE-family HTH domain
VEASEALREARKRAGLTQARLADAAHVRQPLISRIETGREQPSLPTLRRLLAACGFDVALTLTTLTVPEDGRVAHPSSTEHVDELRAALASALDRR